MPAYTSLESIRATVTGRHRGPSAPAKGIARLTPRSRLYAPGHGSPRRLSSSAIAWGDIPSSFMANILLTLEAAGPSTTRCPRLSGSSA